MPLPRWVARFNRNVTNHVIGLVAPYLPFFGVIVHTGRRSHRPYRTPVNIFPRPGGFLIALTYGPNADWVRNVLANGGAILETRGHVVKLTHPRLFHDEECRAMPALPRPILKLVHVSDFLDLAREDAPPTA